MKLDNIVSFTDFARNINKFTDKIEQDDVIVVKNNIPVFVAVKASNYNRYRAMEQLIKNYSEDELQKLLAKKKMYKV